MGQAKRRGSYEERKQAGIKRNKGLLLERLGGRDKRLMAVLRAGLDPFLSRISKGEWESRRRQIIEFLKAHPEPVPLEKAKAIRVRDDERGGRNMLSSLLGGDWAPENSSATVVSCSKHAHVAECDAPVLGAYVVEIGWACGITRIFDSEISIDKKAGDVTKLLSDAVKQVPQEKPSIIHIAADFGVRRKNSFEGSL